MKKLLFESTDGKFRRVNDYDLKLDDVTIDFNNHKISHYIYGSTTSPIIYDKLNKKYIKYQVGSYFNILFDENTDYNNLNIRFYNKKTCNDYVLLSIAVGCTNGDEDSLNAVYKSLDNDILFVRDLKEFFEKFSPYE